jgi:hypothetical protein
LWYGIIIIIIIIIIKRSQIVVLKPLTYPKAVFSFKFVCLNRQTLLSLDSGFCFLLNERNVDFYCCE